MTPILYLFLLSSFVATANVAEAAVSPQPDSLTVYLFLGEECRISQYFTKQLKSLHQEFASERTAFLGLFPTPSSSSRKIVAFQEKYGLPFPLKLDVLQQQMDRFGVTVTPEVVVYDHDTKKVLYQGRVDNTFFRVGKRRPVTTEYDLRDALRDIQEGRPVANPKTTAVGCIITPLSSDLKNATLCAPKN